MLSDFKDAVIIEQRSSHSDVVKRYSKGKLLGKGGFAKCFEFTSLDTRRVYAAKVIQKASLSRSKAKQKLTSEIKIHKSLKFQYIVGFEHFFEDADNVYILLQICPNQTLNELIKRRKRITELEAQCYLYQLALSLKYLHANRIIHRDLKLGNLFLSDKLEIKIGDFGLAAKLDHEGERRRTMCGTPNYIAPQILENKNGHSYEVDIWSFGVIAYAILVGRPPFETSDVKATYTKIKMCNYSFPDSIPLSKTAKNFISKMLLLQPSKRLTVEQILSHEFFTSNPFPKTLPISTLACPPNSNFMKQFLNKEESEGHDTKRGLGQTDKLVFEKQDYMANTDRIPSLNKNRTSTENLAVVAPIRAASTAALVGHAKLGVKKKESIEQINLENKGPQIWVTYHTENPKFGMCYLLNSNSTGMNFNDSTCMISNNQFSRIKYFELNPQLEPANAQTFEIDNFDSSLAKKMKIIHHFNQELRGKRDCEQLKMNHDQRIKSEKLKYKKDVGTDCYVKKYLRSSKAIIFWFNNKDLQIIFQDSTEILLRNQNTVYVNKYGERKHFLFSDYESMTEDIQKRVKYTLEIIKKIKSKPKPATQENKCGSKSSLVLKKPLTNSTSTNRLETKEKTMVTRNTSYGRFAANSHYEN